LADLDKAEPKMNLINQIFSGLKELFYAIHLHKLNSNNIFFK